MPVRPVAALPAIQNGKNLLLERGIGPNPLQGNQDWRQLIATIKRYLDLLNGDNTECRIGVESLSHNCESFVVLGSSWS